MPVNAEEIISVTDQKIAERSTTATVWEGIRALIFPSGEAMVGKETAGLMSHADVLDNTGETAHDILAASVVGTLVPDTIDWQALRAVDEDINTDQECAGWLEDCSRRMMNVFRAPRGGFTACQQEKYADLVSYGTGGSFIAERPGRGIVFTSIPLRQLLLSEDDTGWVDEVFRDFELEARVALKRWGFRAGEKVVKAAQDPRKQYQKFRFIHQVCERHERDPRQRDAVNMPFSSAYVSVEDKHLIVEGGFQEMPYQVPRWSKRSHEVYGRGPGHKALRECRGLQRTMKVTIKGAEKRVDPPLMVADDGILGPVRTGNNAINFFRAGAYQDDPIRPLLTGGDPSIGEEMMAGQRLRIEAAFLKPFIQMIRKDRMSATEVLRVSEEGQIVLGPYLGRLKTEDLGPMVERVFGIMLRGGGFRQMPEKLRGRNIRIEYTSPAVKAQRISQARGLSQFNEITLPLAAQQKEVMDNLDGDLAFRDTADIMGLPKTWIRTPETVQGIRQARQEAQEAAMQQQQMMETVDTAANAVRALPALNQAMGGEDIGDVMAGAGDAAAA